MGVTCVSKLGPAAIPPLLLNRLSVLDYSKGEGPLWFGGVQSLHLSLRESLHQSISRSHSLIVLNLSTSSLSSTTRLSSSHLTQVASFPSSLGSSRLWHSLQPETCTATFLGRPSLWVATVFLGQARCLVETMFKLEVSGTVRRRAGLLSKDKSNKRNTHVSCHKSQLPHLLLQHCMGSVGCALSWFYDLWLSVFHITTSCTVLGVKEQML